MPAGKAHLEIGAEILLHAADSSATRSGALARPARLRDMCRVLRRLGLAGSVLFAGCGWQNSLIAIDRAVPPEPPAQRPCSLAQVQTRRNLPRLPRVEGIAVLLVLRMHAWADSDRLVRSGQSISLVLPPGGASAPVVLRGRVEGIDPGGAPARKGTALVDGGMVRIRIGRSDRPATFAGAEAASRLILAKADVPDQTRPTTCDERLRDGDFIFLRTASPSVWVGLSASGEANGPPVLVARRSETPDSSGCVRDREVCRTDRGGPVCAWTPVCAK